MRSHPLILAAVLAVCASAHAAPEGSTSAPYRLFESLEAATGLRIDSYLQVGLSGNDASTHSQYVQGASSGPLAGPADEGLQLNALTTTVARPLKSNILPRITPLPGPMPQEVSWGFHLEAVYGRNGQPAMAQGLEADWGINQSDTDASAGSNRQNYLAFPQLYAQLYVPVWRGVAFTVGRFAPGIGFEIPVNFRPGPNFFYSRTYAFISQTDQVVGALASANLAQGSAGLLAGELGIVNGRKNWQDNNDDKSLIGALRWRSADMATSVDYSFMRGNEQNDPSEAVQAPVARVISPRGQLRQHHSISASLQATKDINVHAEVLYGRQDGDGQSDTIDILDGANYTGGSYRGLNGQITWRTSPKSQWGLRAETFQDRKRVALFPATAASGDFQALTVGWRHELTANVVVRPELRYDRQTHVGAIKAFGGGTKTHQTTASVDALLYF